VSYEKDVLKIKKKQNITTNAPYIYYIGCLLVALFGGLLDISPMFEGACFFSKPFMNYKLSKKKKNVSNNKKNKKNMTTTKKKSRKKSFAAELDLWPFQDAMRFGSQAYTKIEWLLDNPTVKRKDLPY
jgi:hypothetical protein